MTRRALMAATLAAAMLPTVLFLTRASAHYPGVQATATCIDTTADVTIEVVSWSTDDDARRYNDLVRVYYDDVAIGDGQFLPANDFSFTLTVNRLADGSRHTLKAVAINPFGANHEFGFAGTSRQAEMTLPVSCVPETTVAPTSTTTTTTTTTTTVPTTTLPTQVKGEVVTSLPDAQVAQPVVAQPSFTG